METRKARKIIALGGAWHDLETLAIEKEIIRFAQKEHLRVLSIPMASSDNEEMWQIFQHIYGQRRCHFPYSKA